MLLSTSFCTDFYLYMCIDVVNAPGLNVFYLFETTASEVLNLPQLLSEGELLVRNGGLEHRVTRGYNRGYLPRGGKLSFFSRRLR
jgi:hypothetical protein